MALVPLVEILFDLVGMLLWLYWWIVIAAVVVSWLVAFHVLNTYSPAGRWVVRALGALTDPVFRRIRRIVPAIGGLDLSPMIVLLVIWVLQQLIVRYEPMLIYSMQS
ncbi:MAG TPA: YggT family protein [Rhizomicrobium sp.]|nr:YggT family protein [Rhizomicrobium sp.]